MSEIIPEITVTGQKRPQGIFARQYSGGGLKPITEKPFIGEKGFVAPPVVPVVEEIVVTAQRSSALKAAAKAAKFNIAGIAATALGVIGAELARTISQRRLDLAGEKATRTTPARPDTQVKTIEPEVIPEIIVTAQAQPLVRPPIPQFYSWDDDPFIMQTVRPRTLTPVETTPQIVDIPVEIPTPIAPSPLSTPLPQPVGIPLPKAIPFPLGMPLPMPSPISTPRPTPIPTPFVTPMPTPMPTPTPTPTPIPTPTVTPTPLTRAQPLPLPFNFSQGCPPCPPPKKCKRKKDKDKKRKTCYRQLVKQGETAGKDKISRWAQIDCVTGKTLKELI